MILILIDADTEAIIGLSTVEGEAKKRLNYAIKKIFSGI